MNPYTPSQEQLAYEKAAKRVEELKGFYGNLISYFLSHFNFLTSKLRLNIIGFGGNVRLGNWRIFSRN